MAKRKLKSPKVSKKVQAARDRRKAELEDPAINIAKIQDQCDTVTVLALDCCICSEHDEMDSMSEEELAREAYDSGWRYATSDKFAVEGMMCPECYKTPDERRGED